MFIISVARAELDLQHLWFGRRAATRIRSQLMAAIYDKALKRKDFSGIIDSDKGKTTEDKKDATTANGTGNFILISCLLHPNARPARQREDQGQGR